MNVVLHFPRQSIDFKIKAWGSVTVNCGEGVGKKGKMVESKKRADECEVWAVRQEWDCTGVGLAASRAELAAFQKEESYLPNSLVKGQ